MRITGVVKRGRLSGGTTAAIMAAFSWALNGWDTSTALASAAAAGVQGATAVGVSAVFAFFCPSLPGATGNRDWLRTISGNTGYRLHSVNNDIRITAGTGAAQVTTTIHTLAAADVGKFHVVGFSADLVNLNGFYDNAASGTSVMGAYTAAAGQRMQLGSTITPANPMEPIAWLGCAGRDSGLVLADFQTICAATKAAGQLSLGGISMAHRWNAAQSPNVPATFADQIGADTLSFVVGSPTNLLSSRFARLWGF